MTTTYAELRPGMTFTGPMTGGPAWFVTVVGVTFPVPGTVRIVWLMYDGKVMDMDYDDIARVPGIWRVL